MYLVNCHRNYVGIEGDGVHGLSVQEFEQCKQYGNDGTGAAGNPLDQADFHLSELKMEIVLEGVEVALGGQLFEIGLIGLFLCTRQRLGLFFGKTGGFKLFDEVVGIEGDGVHANEYSEKDGVCPCGVL